MFNDENEVMTHNLYLNIKDIFAFKVHYYNFKITSFTIYDLHFIYKGTILAFYQDLSYALYTVGISRFKGAEIK